MKSTYGQEAIELKPFKFPLGSAFLKRNKTINGYRENKSLDTNELLFSILMKNLKEI